MLAERIVVEEPSALPRTVALRLARTLHAALGLRSWATIALPAGAFVRAFYAELRQCALDWSRVEFFFSEERGVPPSHPASAFAEAELRLFGNPRIGTHQVHLIEGAAPDLDYVAERYAEELPEAFDLMLFEPGSDGRLGALLAHSPAFDDERDVLPLQVPQKPHRRVALGPRVIRAALDVVVVAQGPQHAEVARRVLAGDEQERELPAALVRERCWILDRAAAAQLSGR